MSHRFRRGAAGAAALLVLTACSTTGADEQTRSAGQDGYVGVARNVTEIAVPERKPVPVISGPALGGDSTVSTDAYQGKVVVVNVWGSWCPPCRSEAAGLQAASVQTKDVAQFVGITSRDNDPAQAEAFVRVNDITYPSIFDPDGSLLLRFARDLPPSAIPSTMVIDADGRLAVRILGPISELTLVDIVEKVASGQ